MGGCAEIGGAREVKTVMQWATMDWKEQVFHLCRGVVGRIDWGDVRLSRLCCFSCGLGCTIRLWEREGLGERTLLRCRVAHPCDTCYY